MTIRVAVVIKALNEERHIARSIESALAAVAPFGGEVILADSYSTDTTISIASRYPVKIVQLADIADRSCGVGAQLGFQYVDADYVYILDGDMELLDTFIPVALQRLEKNNLLAGIAGLVEELGGGNYEFESRKALQDGRVIGSQDALDMGGLYRVDAIRKVSYLTNRNLHSYEEKELGRRLIGAGYSLERIAVPAIKHYGRTEQSFPLLMRRWTTHHIDGPGEWMRAAIGDASFWSIAKYFKQLWIVFAGWVALFISMLMVKIYVVPLFITLLAHIFLLFVLLIKKRSLRLALMGFIHLQVYTAGMVRGLLRHQESPSDQIRAVVLQDISK